MLQYPLVWAALAVAAGPGRALVRGLVRGRLAGVARSPRAGSIGLLDLAIAPRVWLLPLRELMSVAVMVASYAGRQVDWRGHTLHAEGFNPR